MRFPGKLLFSGFLSFTLYNAVSAQFQPLHALMPPNFSILATAAGDINQDGKKDLVVILRNPYERMNTDTTRPLLLLAGNGKGRYRLLARNDSVVLCMGCGGVHGDPYAGITVRRGYFAIRHFGGSSWRWTRVIAFRYDSRRKQFVLHRDDGWSWHNLGPAERTKISNRPVDFDRVSFTAFSYQTAWENK